MSEGINDANKYITPGFGLGNTLEISDELVPSEIIDKINHENFFFFNIGASDGKYVDPLYEYIVKYNWAGIRFEPQKSSYKELEKLHENDPNVITVNAGIAEKTGTFKLYDHDMGRGGSSLLLRRGHCDPEMYEEIVCMTFTDAINTYNLDKDNIDLVNMDTEGYDMIILDSIDLEFSKPKNIWFEKWMWDFDDLNNPEKSTSFENNMHILEKYKNYGYKYYDFKRHGFLSLSI